MTTSEQKQISSKCRSLLTQYSDILEYVANEIKTESDGLINEETSDKIALEYSRRQGMKLGVTLFLQKLNSKANIRE